jgi:hypothetical protein
MKIRQIKRPILKNGRFLLFGLIFGASAASPCFGSDARTIAGLRRLDPDMRLEQICDLEAMDRIAREDKRFHPDRAKSNVTAPPEHLADTLKASGGAFRSAGRWYAFAFVCKGSADHLAVTAFDYRIGDLIPKSKWADYDLWP